MQTPTLHEIANDVSCSFTSLKEQQTCSRSIANLLSRLGVALPNTLTVHTQAACSDTDQTPTIAIGMRWKQHQILLAANDETLLALSTCLFPERVSASRHTVEYGIYALGLLNAHLSAESSVGVLLESVRTYKEVQCSPSAAGEQEVSQVYCTLEYRFGVLHCYFPQALLQEQPAQTDSSNTPLSSVVAGTHLPPATVQLAFCAAPRSLQDMNIRKGGQVALCKQLIGYQLGYVPTSKPEIYFIAQPAMQTTGICGPFVGTTVEEKEEKMELGLHIRLGEVRLSVQQLLEMRKGSIARLDWCTKREVGMWFDEQCIAQGFLQTDGEELYFQAEKVFRSLENEENSMPLRKLSEKTDDTSSAEQ